MEEGNHHLHVYHQIFSNFHVGLVSLGTLLYTKELDRILTPCLH